MVVLQRRLQPSMYSECHSLRRTLLGHLKTSPLEKRRKPLPWRKEYRLTQTRVSKMCHRTIATQRTTGKIRVRRCLCRNSPTCQIRTAKTSVCFNGNSPERSMVSLPDYTTKHWIYLCPGEPLVSQPPYRTDRKDREEKQSQLNKMVYAIVIGPE